MTIMSHYGVGVDERFSLRIHGLVKGYWEKSHFLSGTAIDKFPMTLYLPLIGITISKPIYWLKKFRVVEKRKA